MSIYGSLRVLGAAAGFLFVASVATAADSISVVVAEQVFFAAYQGQTFSNLAETSGFSIEQKKSLIASLKGYSLMKERLPLAKWQEGSSVVTVGEGASSFTLDFAEIEKNKIKVNNTVVAIPRDALISEIYSKMKSALSEKNAEKNSKRKSAGISELWMSSAYAADETALTPQQLLKQAETAQAKELTKQGFAATTLSVVGQNSMSYWQSQQKLTDGQKNAKAILSDLAASDKYAKNQETAALVEFKCSEKVFYYTYNYNYIDRLGHAGSEVHKVFIDHDKTEVRVVSSQEYNQSPNGRRSNLTCHYVYDPTKGNIYATQDKESMQARGTQCIAKKGEVATTGTSVKRVVSCCKDLECRGALNSAIRSGKNARDASKEVINPQGNGGVQ
jgi:hypothetical protein